MKKEKLTLEEAKRLVSKIDESAWEGEPNRECEKCGRTYDDIGYDYQYCKKCGWDADNKKWCNQIEPTNADIECGEADFNGSWI